MNPTLEQMIGNRDIAVANGWDFIAARYDARIERLADMDTDTLAEADYMATDLNHILDQCCA